MTDSSNPTPRTAVRLDALEHAFMREVTNRWQDEFARQAVPIAAPSVAPAESSATPADSPISRPTAVAGPALTPEPGRSRRADTAWRAPHPIGSTLPGPLFNEEMPPGVLPRANPPLRSPALPDVPRLPQGVVLQWPVRFHAAGGDYARLWAMHVLLLLLTGGLAWPWVMQRREQFFLRNTRVVGHALDHRLEAVSLWPRFALTLAIALGVGAAALQDARTGWLAMGLAALVWPVVIHLRMQQQVVSITWAGRRLWLEGGLLGVYRASMGGVLLAMAGAALTALAWAPDAPVPWWAAAVAWSAWILSVPWVSWAVLRHRQAHLRLGPFRMLWKVSAADFSALWHRSIVWSAVVFAALAGLGALVLALGLLVGRATGRPGVSREALTVLVGLLAVAWAVVVVPFIQARLINLVWGKTGNRHFRFRSDIPVKAYTRLHVRLAIRLLLTAGLYWPWAVVQVRRLRMQSLQVWSRVDVDVMLAHWPTTQGDTAPVAVSPVSVMPDEIPSASSLQQVSGLYKVRA
ncbi:DUF898 family protein [Aquabacterium lacunae]|uniref:DUF898 family protein n=1 Tax=Aquabacterium lacunae TaxID=2528630 RepID=A0A4Q9GYJ9_9BURK|nr:DUF898 family protein [Aquabacterium lacunae]TBO31291.1 DUF898 family protein [Aquabacterium lacunae]